jgi:hypothetical protein
MSFGLNAAEYLEMLVAEHRAFKRSTLSIRRAINCCGFANALPEIIFAQYGAGSTQVHGCARKEDYRTYLRERSEAHHLVRDLCDMSKHGEKLDRQSVRVKEAKSGSQKKQIAIGALGSVHTFNVRCLIITFADGHTGIVEDIIDAVVESWQKLFQEDDL